jgi:hypothetical protein
MANHGVAAAVHTFLAESDFCVSLFCACEEIAAPVNDLPQGGEIGHTLGI